VNAELLVDALRVGLHGVLGHEQALGDGGHGMPLGKQREDVALPRSQAVSLGQGSATGRQHLLGGPGPFFVLPKKNGLFFASLAIFVVLCVFFTMFA